ncbi:unnamed protein product [Coregonus sp. 'balchen']|nr:unnamed protein product [Coregonus sp. 'balchen']
MSKGPRRGRLGLSSPVELVKVVAQAVLFMCMNTAGIFISYLSDRAQRQAFLETRRIFKLVRLLFIRIFIHL